MHCLVLRMRVMLKRSWGKMAVVRAALLVWLAVSCVECGGRDYEVRGLDPRNKPRYHPGKDFTCLDGSDTIAFSMGALASFPRLL